MIVPLEINNKEQFVLGTLPCPASIDPLHEAWKRCNKMVMSWLTRSMTPLIKQLVMWMDTTFYIWIDLLECFLDGDKFRIADLQEELQNCKQGDSTVSQYYTRLKALWKELSMYRTLLFCTCSTSCNCGLISKIQKERDDDYIIKFLRGLNDGQVRSQVMLMEPMPNLMKTFSLVLQQEHEVSGSFSNISQESIANVNFQDNSHNSSFPNRGRGSFNKSSGRNNKYCDHCKRTENCWIKRGLPPGYKNNKNYVGPSKPFASIIAAKPSIISDCFILEVNKSGAPFGFSKEQYQAILALLQQSQKPSLLEPSVHQCTINPSGSVPSSSTWILDSGATNHIFPFKSAFTTLTPTSPILIRLPNQQFVTAKFSGTIVLGNLILHNTLFVFDFSVQLISIPKLINSNDFLKLPYSTSTNRTMSFFELIHANIWGPITITSIEGYKYFLTIVDDYNRFTWILFLKNKSDVKTVLPNFIILTENQFSCKLKRLRSDNGKKFFINDFYNAKGIFHETSCVETCELQWLQYLFNDLEIPVPIPYSTFCDSQSTIQIAKNPTFHERTKHIKLIVTSLDNKFKKALLDCFMFLLQVNWLMCSQSQPENF
uniref:Retrovirus-related Pol polyprotein from transposon TNT 1-94 n=1 Tax=Cajanus cajan TaxID=3821 RepID=A0A151R7V4_CAJCA|nr:Retrovirus-related Pol polyprotein from transposon TNT 1-94 [Cajanus cajan]